MKQTLKLKKKPADLLKNYKNKWRKIIRMIGDEDVQTISLIINQAHQQSCLL